MNYPCRIALFSLMALALAGCKEHERAAKAESAAPLAVSTLVLERSMQPRLCELPGTVTPKEFALVSARVMGTVARADFAIGQRVEEGSLLVVLSAPDMAARVDQAQAALDKAKRDYERESGLLESGASTAQTVRDLGERLRMAEAGLVEAQSLYSYTKVTAPFDGNITRKMVNAGDFAAPGTPLFEIAGESGLRVEVSVPDSFPMLPNGTELGVSDSSNTFTAILSESSFAADPRSRTRLAKLDLGEGAQLRSGQFVRAFWQVGELREMVLPKSAVSRFGQIERVYVVRDGRAYLRIIRTGENYGDSVQVLSGLEEGDEVVVNAPAALVNGSPVEVR
ncbi:MAG: efflux RND transporter periplasmic adaptor subunit [Opitutales bacterium]|nr:efflux RND transporter periplasmic adaptor subunit [Opitutales bacterium]